MYRRGDRYGQQDGMAARKYDDGRDRRDMRRKERDNEMELMAERQRKQKMAEELMMRERQLALTSSLLEKQSMMIQNLESNMISQNSMHPGMANNMMNMNMNQSFQRPMNVHNDGPPAKRFKKDQFQFRGGGRRSRGERGAAGRGNVLEKQRCYNCRLTGHFARDCKNKRAEEGSTANVKSPGRFSSKDDKSTSKTVDKKPSTTDSKKPKISYCKLCSKSADWRTHGKDPEHVRRTDVCRGGCKVCSKKRFSNMDVYKKHLDSPIHRALINKKQQVTESKIKPYTAETITGVEYVVPVTGFFCRLCKKFYNKEQYAKVQHCQTKAHYEHVAAVVGSKYETAIGVKFTELNDKITKENKDNKILDRQILEAVRKADFTTGIKPIKVIKPSNSATVKTEGENTTEKSSTEEEVKEEKTEADMEGEEVEVKGEEQDEEEHPDDLEMEVLDDLDDEQEAVEEAVDDEGKGDDNDKETTD